MNKLNSKEISILKAIALGNKTDDIAKNMQLSPNTIDTYIKIMLLKTGAVNRTNMIFIATKQGLIQ